LIERRAEVGDTGLLFFQDGTVLTGDTDVAVLTVGEDRPIIGLVNSATSILKLLKSTVDSNHPFSS